MLLVVLLITLGMLTALVYLGLPDEPGFPLDDAWIHQVYARNLGTRGEMAFAVGQPSTGSTSPTWTALLSLGYLLNIPPTGWAYLWGTIFAIAAAALAAVLSYRYFGRTEAMAAFLTLSREENVKQIGQIIAEQNAAVTQDWVGKMIRIREDDPALSATRAETMARAGRELGEIRLGAREQLAEAVTNTVLEDVRKRGISEAGYWLYWTRLRAERHLAPLFNENALQEFVESYGNVDQQRAAMVIRRQEFIEQRDAARNLNKAAESLQTVSTQKGDRTLGRPDVDR